MVPVHCMFPNEVVTLSLMATLGSLRAERRTVSCDLARRWYWLIRFSPPFSFTIRFRVYDITAVDSGNDFPVKRLGECFSQPFRVYSPRKCVQFLLPLVMLPADRICLSSFPGLPKPTAIAEHFARQGFKLNTRKVGQTNLYVMALKLIVK